MEEKGNRGLKTRTAFSTALETSIYERLKQYKNKTDIPMSRIMDKAIKEYLEKYDK